ncbi:response regulator [Mucilaginibacter sp. AW1-3]
MLEHVLIAEDHESANISLRKTLEELAIAKFHFVYYCDDAFAALQIASRTTLPYDLLITDLFFEEDHQPQRLADGQALIAAARALQPSLKVLVFSAEHRIHVIDDLFSKLGIDGYVRKARHDAQHLKEAIQKIAGGGKYYPAYLRQAIKHNAHSFTEFDIAVLGLLAAGVLQKNIPGELQKMGVRPSGLSSVEKRLNLVRDALGCTNNEQLVAYCKDQHVI